MILTLRVSVVKHKVAVLNELGDAVNFELRVVQADVWVRDRHDINFSSHRLLRKEWTFPHADTYAHLRTTHVVERWLNLRSFFLNQEVKVDVDVATTSLVLCVSVRLRLLHFFELSSSLSPSSLHFLDVVHHVTRAWLAVFLHLSLLFQRDTVLVSIFLFL